MKKINLRSIDLNLLVALEVLLEECHITNSATRLNLSQSAMSHILNRLRGTFDDDLLVRVSNGYEKTARAKQLELPLKEVLEQVKLLLKEDDFDPATYKGTFNIYTLDYGEIIAIPRLMKTMLKEAPNVQINILHRKLDSQENILNKNCDLVFGAILKESPKNCKMQFLFEDTYVCAMDKNHPLANKELTLENYLQYPHSLIHPGTIVENPIDIKLKKTGLSRRIAKHTPHFMASVMSLKDTHLLQTMPKRMVEQIATTHDLIQKELPFEIKPIRFAQMWHAKNENNKVHKWFREKIEAAISGGSC